MVNSEDGRTRNEVQLFTALPGDPQVRRMRLEVQALHLLHQRIAVGPAARVPWEHRGETPGTG